MTTNLTTPFAMTIAKRNLTFTVRFSHFEGENNPIFVAVLMSSPKKVLRRWRTAPTKHTPKRDVPGVPWEVVTREEIAGIAKDFMDPEPKAE